MKTAQKTTEQLDVFVERLTEEKGLSELDPEILAELRSDLKARVEDRVNAAIVSKLPPASLEDFEKLLDGADEEKIQSFCRERIPDLDQIMAAELLDFRQTYLNP